MKELLSEKNVPFAYADIAASMTALKSFLVIRDTSDVYKDRRGTRTIGIPMLMVDDTPYLVGGVENATALIESLHLAE